MKEFRETILNLIILLIKDKMMNSEKRRVICDSIFKAIIETERVLANNGEVITSNINIAKLWADAGSIIYSYYPDNELGYLLLNKAQAWSNPERYSNDEILKIKDVKIKLDNFIKNKSKIF